MIQIILYVKCNLTKEALNHFPALQQISRREGAGRTSLIVLTTLPWTLPANLGLTLHPDLDYVAVKAPSLDGTEIWIMPQECQASVEQAAGFKKPSQPLLTFKADKGMGVVSTDFPELQDPSIFNDEEAIIEVLQDSGHLLGRAEVHCSDPDRKCFREIKL